MLYTAYEWQRRLSGPTVAASHRIARALGGLPAPLASMGGPRRLRAACQVVSGARPTHVRPDWRIDSVTVDGLVTDVDIRPDLSTPFATLLHFSKPAVGPQPKVLLVGPISGHFATLLRPTVRTLLADHDVHVLDWHNARDVPAAEGRFGLDEYIDHVLQAIRHLGPDTHVLAVCQPAPLVLAAVSVLARTATPPCRAPSHSSPARSTPGSTPIGSTRSPTAPRCRSTSASSSPRCRRATPVRAGGCTRASRN